jgi:hypothetical protein
MEAEPAKPAPSSKQAPTSASTSTSQAEELKDQACATCGREAVIVIDGTGWCESCLHARGSCCAESEMEDE